MCGDKKREHARGAAHQTPCALKKAFEKAQQAQRCAAPAPAAPPRNLPTTRRIAAKTASKSAVRRRRRRQRRKLAVSRAGELTRAAVEYVDVRSSAGARDASDSPRLRTNALDAGEGDPTARWRHDAPSSARDADAMPARVRRTKPAIAGCAPRQPPPPCGFPRLSARCLHVGTSHRLTSRPEGLSRCQTHTRRQRKSETATADGFQRLTQRAKDFQKAARGAIAQ